MMKCKLCGEEREPQCHDNRELCLSCRRIEIQKKLKKVWEE